MSLRYLLTSHHQGVSSKGKNTYFQSCTKYWNKKKNMDSLCEQVCSKCEINGMKLEETTGI